MNFKMKNIRVFKKKWNESPDVSNLLFSNVHRNTCPTRTHNKIVINDGTISLLRSIVMALFWPLHTMDMSA